MCWPQKGKSPNTNLSALVLFFASYTTDKIPIPLRSHESLIQQLCMEIQGRHPEVLDEQMH